MALISALSGIDTVKYGIASLGLVSMASALIKPQDERVGISGFLFDVNMSESINFSAQVTDHFTEENISIQDHVAIEPVKVTLVGKIGELVFRTVAALAFAQATADRLTPLNILTPAQSLLATQVIAKAYLAISAANATKNLLMSADVFGAKPYKNNQQKAFNAFETMFYERWLNTIETPWKSYENMIIESWSAEQDETTQNETTFTLNFKQIRMVETETNTGKLSGRNITQLAPTSNKGTNAPVKTILYNAGETTGVIAK